MKLQCNIKRTCAILAAVLLIISCVISGVGTVTASASSYETTNIHLATGKLKGQTIGTYAGEMANGVPQGFGIIEYSFGGGFVGNFENGLPEGYGIYVNLEGTCTEGEWSWGSGTLSLDSDREGADMTYNGMFCDGKASGFGELTLEKCGTFYGEFFDGEVKGWGIYAYQSPMPEKEPLIDGSDWAMVWGSRKHDHVYNGLTLDGKWQGFGLGVTESGGHYVGEIRNEFRQGYGRAYLAGNQLLKEGTFNAGELVKSTQGSSSSANSGTKPRTGGGIFDFGAYDWESGTINDDWNDNCFRCGGSGDCNTCGGSGSYGYTASSFRGDRCPTCEGNGRCLYCNGRGRS